MNLRRIMMATGTAALLAVAAISTASAQVQERSRTNSDVSGPNVSPGGQMNAQRPSRSSGVNAQTQFQGSTGQIRNQAQFQGSNRVEGTNSNRNAMTRERGDRLARDRDRGRFVSGRDRDRFASSARYSDRDRFANGRYRDRDRFVSARFGDRDRVAYGAATTYAGDTYAGNTYAGNTWGGWGGWGSGPTFGVAVGAGWPGYSDYGYGYGYPGLYSYSPGYAGVGFGGGGCSCNRGWGP
jgi:hypothetical protein